ncbi:MAG TPA: hypothetical protein VL282_18245 [Tepidisphaeraceae bacterium]|jgi:hypothetical protein|nr:hypothetical protein [Tepidisphaeraceae bacterium]
MGLVKDSSGCGREEPFTSGEEWAEILKLALCLFEAYGQTLFMRTTPVPQFFDPIVSLRSMVLNASAPSIYMTHREKRLKMLLL